MKGEVYPLNPRCPKAFPQQPASFAGSVAAHCRRRWLTIVPAFLLLELSYSLLKCLPPSMLWLRDPPHFPLLSISASQKPISFLSSLSSSSPPFSSKICLSPGRVYVYELPQAFNKELTVNCHDLNPWGSRCKMLENGGFGRRATFPNSTVPEDILGAWFATDQFSLEVIFHTRMLRHPCRTLDPVAATAFFVPFYGGLAVGKYLWSPDYNERDRDCKLLLEWLRRQEWWQRSGGRDHFLMLGRITWDFRRSQAQAWGSSFLSMPEMQKVTRLLLERDPWDTRDMAVPYPTSFHPRCDADIDRWLLHVRSVARVTLFSFAGATRSSFRGDFRAEVLRQCQAAGGRCRSVDCREARCESNTSATIGLFLESEFCLQPRGDSFTRRSVFDCMVAGAIPVFFWRRTGFAQYMWHLPVNPESYSVFIDRRHVKRGTSIEGVLSGIRAEKVRAMREAILLALPQLVYASPSGGLGRYMDAFDVAVDGVLRRFHHQNPDD
ncbi:unnamed protein product [Victoria cruziana]